MTRSPTADGATGSPTWYPQKGLFDRPADPVDAGKARPRPRSPPAPSGVARGRAHLLPHSNTAASPVPSSDEASATGSTGGRIALSGWNELGFGRGDRSCRSGFEESGSFRWSGVPLNRSGVLNGPLRHGELLFGVSDQESVIGELADPPRIAVRGVNKQATGLPA